MNSSRLAIAFLPVFALAQRPSGRFSARTTLYTVSRTLAKWQSLGLIESRKRLLFVRSARRLEEVAGAEED